MAEPGGTAAGSGLVRLVGSCHCGNLELTFETRQQPGDVTVRACGCSFCRHHGARTVSDPEGRIAFVVHDPAELNRYRFGLGTADFLLCRTCGCYVGAIMEDAGLVYAIVNVNALQTPEVFAQAAVPVSYDGEVTAERQSRRRARWTPAEVVERADAHQSPEPGDRPR